MSISDALSTHMEDIKQAVTDGIYSLSTHIIAGHPFSLAEVKDIRTLLAIYDAADGIANRVKGTAP